MTTAELELSDMRVAAGQACNLMKVLANPDRLMILCQLSQGELRVGELEDSLGIVQPTLSQQLTVLREQQLVSTRREGKHIFYTLSSPQALAMIQTLYQQFCQPACSRSHDELSPASA
jgi:DNA-binding transcriptional ArsR family regulator